MDPATQAEARLDALESRAMQQDRVIEDLNTALTAQWRIIDRLTRQVANLDERVQEFGKGPGAAAPDAPPPHY